MAGTSSPRNCGWLRGKATRAETGAAQTGRPVRSASATTASQAPDASTSSPTTRTAERAPAMRSARCRTVSRAGPVAWMTRRAAAACAPRSSASVSSASKSSMGRETNTGPCGGVSASWAARASAGATSAGRGGSYAHFTAGCGRSVAWGLESRASIVSMARTCWPAVTTMGVRLARALRMAPMAFPVPGPVCRFTRAVVPEARAKPSAMPTTTASWRPSTYRKSSGNRLSMGSSVDPGLPNTVVMPRALRTSRTASRTVRMCGSFRPAGNN